MKARQILTLAALAAALWLLPACSLAGDVTPPPGYQPTAVPPQPTQAQAATQAGPSDVSAPAVPAAPPSAVEGRLLYVQHCAACHGEQGSGGGAMTAQLPGPVPDFSTPDLARSRTPAEWFQIITEGRIDQLMPPWDQDLTEAQRWSAIAYLYTLSTPQEQIDQGQAVYSAHCAECHGETGQGDGPKAATLEKPPADFADLATLAGRSQADLFQSVSEGVDQVMPAFASELSEAERWAALDYVRTFAYEYLAPDAPLPELLGTIQGSVVNGTAGQGAPAGLRVMLHGFDSSGMAVTLSATVDASGQYVFPDVKYRLDSQFILTTQYGDLTYNSDTLSFGYGQPTLDIPLVVYETTTDGSALRFDRMHMFVEDAGDGSLTVGELLILSNLGDQTVVGGADGTVVQVPLPAGVAYLSVDGETEGQSYVRTSDGLALMNPVFPGQSVAQVLLYFTLPYEPPLDFEQAFRYPVGTLNVMVSDSSTRLQGQGLQDLGFQQVQGMSFQSYMHDPVAAGGSVAFQVSRGAAAGGSAAGAGGGSTTGLALGLGALALVMVGVGVWWYRRSAGPAGSAESGESREDLLQAIVELDEAYEAGEVEEQEYQRERAWLKAELKKRWQ